MHIARNRVPASEDEYFLSAAQYERENCKKYK